MVFGHVQLELLRVGAGGRLPARVLLTRVEVVRQILAVAVAHFPARGEASIGLLCPKRRKTSTLRRAAHERGGTRQGQQ